MKTSFSQRSRDPIRLKIIAVVNEGSKVLDISTRTLVGLPDLASDGSPLFAEPMFLFGWTLCNTSTYCMLTFWLSCLNYALRGEAWGISITACHRLLEDIFTYALFWLTRVCVSLKKQLPYCTISFSWNQRLLEPKFLCDECSVNLYNFFAKVRALFVKWKRISLLSKSSPLELNLLKNSAYIVVHRKGLV